MSLKKVVWHTRLLKCPGTLKTPLRHWAVMAVAKDKQSLCCGYFYKRHFPFLKSQCLACLFYFYLYFYFYVGFYFYFYNRHCYCVAFLFSKDNALLTVELLQLRLSLEEITSKSQLNWGWLLQKVSWGLTWGKTSHYCYNAACTPLAFLFQCSINESWPHSSIIETWLQWSFSKRWPQMPAPQPNSTLHTAATSELLFGSCCPTLFAVFYFLSLQSYFQRVRRQCSHPDSTVHPTLVPTLTNIKNVKVFKYQIGYYQVAHLWLHLLQLWLYRLTVAVRNWVQTLSRVCSSRLEKKMWKI